MVSFSVVAQTGGLDFGVKSLNYREVCKIARSSEQLGFDGLVYSDHAFYGRRPFPETWTTLCALAVQTKRVRIGTHVACYNYHAPPLIAKMAANIDQISMGRFHFGIGACGWGQEVEHPTYGLELPRVDERIRRLREAVIVIKMMFNEDSPSFAGEYYSIKGAVLNPRPVQRPLPVWIGGSGNRTLDVVAELADGWDTGFARSADYDKMLVRLESACEKFGRRPNRIRRGFSTYQTIIASNPESARMARRRLHAALLENKRRHHIAWVREMSEEEYVERRFWIGGTIGEIIDRIDGFVKRGAKNFFFSFADFPNTSMLELFAEKVIPQFKRN